MSKLQNMQAIWFWLSCDKVFGQILPAANETKFREALPIELPFTMFRASSSYTHKTTLVFRKKEKTEYGWDWGTGDSALVPGLG